MFYVLLTSSEHHTSEPDSLIIGEYGKITARDTNSGQATNWRVIQRG